jgi:hypothetical protein
MTRYQADKILKEVVLDDAAAQAYRSDRAAYLEGRDLTDAEREALMAFDYVSLYSMGVHPFLLNGFVMKVWPGDRQTAQREYLGAIANLGYPDFAT